MPNMKLFSFFLMCAYFFFPGLVFGTLYEFAIFEANICVCVFVSHAKLCWYGIVPVREYVIHHCCFLCLRLGPTSYLDEHISL